VLRAFHGQPQGGRAAGALRVERGPGALRAWLGRRLQLPPAGEHVAVKLRVLVEGERERWVREFDGQPVETLQWLEDGHIIEQSGALRVRLRLTVADGSFRIDPDRAWFGPIPLPRFLGPRGGALLEAGASDWRVDVTVSAPVVGLLVHYVGSVVPETAVTARTA
jgi:hypothetical protein